MHGVQYNDKCLRHIQKTFTQKDDDGLKGENIMLDYVFQTKWKWKVVAWTTWNTVMSILLTQKTQ